MYMTYLWPLCSGLHRGECSDLQLQLLLLLVPVEVKSHSILVRSRNKPVVKLALPSIWSLGGRSHSSLLFVAGLQALAAHFQPGAV